VSVYRSDPAAPGANLRRRRIDTSAERLDLAVERFNASLAARTVAGLTRSLGQPRVSVGTAAGSSSQVRITVAWELCWYQWAVDAAGEEHSVIEIGKGDDVEQLDRSARQWNARVGEGTRLIFGAAGRPPRRRMSWLRRG
jgi:hypothetical protein